MSFQDEVKQELAEKYPRSKTALKTAAAGILVCLGTIRLEETSGKRKERLLTLHFPADAAGIAVRTKFFTLLEKAFNIFFVSEDAVSENVPDEQIPTEDVTLSGKVTDLICREACVRAGADGTCIPDVDLKRMLLQSEAGYRSFLGSVFLCIGSVGDPHRQYRWELSCRDQSQAQYMQAILSARDIGIGTDPRRGDRVIWSRDAEIISALLNLTDATNAQLRFENIRIVRQMRGSVNRQVNFETSNIRKSAQAAKRQIEDIELVRGNAVWNSLPESLRDIAAARLEYPEASLGELGELMRPPIGKSGVNHRLRRISEVAEKIRRKSS